MRSVLLIILLMGENSLAGVSLIEKETSTEFRRENLQQSTKAPLLNNRVTKIYKLSKTKAKLTPNNWYEVNGVLNQHYVYLVIENTRKIKFPAIYLMAIKANMYMESGLRIICKFTINRIIV